MESDSAKSAGIYDLLGWLDAHKDRLIWIAGGLLVVGFVVSYFVWSGNQQEVKASEALSNLHPSPSGAGSLTSVAPEAYLKLASQYAKTGAGARALLLGAGGLFAEGKYPEAQSQFEKFLREHPESPFRTQALLGVAASLDAQGKINEATTRYKELTARYPSDPAAAPAKSALARLYEVQKKPEQALQLYQELAPTASYSSVGLEATIRMEELLLKHPNLAKTNAPTSSIDLPKP